MRVLVSDHPLVQHKLSVLRDVATPSGTFRALAAELMLLLGVEATRDLPVSPKRVTTPLAEMTGAEIASPEPLVVPILRAGLGLLDGMTRLLPTAEVGFLGMVRDETTLEPTTYASRLPNRLDGRPLFLLDPMLATGGSLIAAIDEVLERGASTVTAICLIAAPEGVAALEQTYGDLDLTLVLGALDDHLNERGFIVPGLGDAGDRLYGVVD